MKKLYYLPLYLIFQVVLRIPGEDIERYNKYQDTTKQSLSEFIEYESEFAPIPLNKGARLIWGIILMVTLLIVITSK